MEQTRGLKTGRHRLWIVPYMPEAQAGEDHISCPTFTTLSSFESEKASPYGVMFLVSCRGRRGEDDRQANKGDAELARMTMGVEFSLTL